MLLSGRGSGWSASLVAIFAALAICIALPDRAPAVQYEPEPPFCQAHETHDFLAPLKRMPKLHQPAENGRIGFGPESLRLRSSPSLLAGGGEVGVTLAPLQRKGMRLRWTVGALLVKVDGKGRPIARVGRLLTPVGRLKPVSGQDFGLEVPDEPGFYRFTVALLGASGKKLGQFGFYYRVLPSLGATARLRLNASSYRPETTVFARVENFGTDYVSYGVDYRIERLEGGVWTTAPESPDGFWIMIGLASPPGMSGRCTAFQVPGTMPPGHYRMVKGVSFRSWPEGERVEQTLTAEFDLAP
jgi:hypothetical protein